MTDQPLVTLHRDGAVLTLTFQNPPDGLMDAAVLAALDDALEIIEAASRAPDVPVRAVVFTGGVPGAFIRHYDVREIGSVLGERAHRAVPRTHAIYDRVQALPVPTIAAINGACMGGGLEFALCCDLRYAAADAGPFGFPEITVGIFPGAGGTQRAARAIGPARALELMLTGRTFGAEEAYALGLVHGVFADLPAHAREVAKRLSRRPAATVSAIKVLVAGNADVEMSEGLAAESRRFIGLLAHDGEVRASLERFLAQSDPVAR